MTTTVTLANMPTSPSDVAVNLMNQSLLKLRATSQSGNQITQEYVYLSGDPTTETTVLVTTSTDVKGNTLRTSISLRTVQTVTVDSVVKEVAPVVVSMSWTTPGASEDTAKLSKMIGTCYGLTFHSLTTKVPDLDTIDALNRGLTTGLFW